MTYPPLITRREALFVLLAALAVMALTCVPYLIAAQPGYAGPGLHFAGFIWGGDDANVYLSQIRQYSEGHLFAYDQFTTLPQQPRYLNLLWLTLGQARRLTGLPLVLLYHLARVVCGALLLYVIYLLAAEAGLSRRGRKLAFLLAAFSSGLGWIVYMSLLAGQMSLARAASLGPLDLAAGWQAMPEALVSLTLLLSPLFAAGMALMGAVYLWGMRAARAPGLGATALCGLFLLLLGNVHTYDVLTVIPVLGLWFLLLAVRRQLTWPAALGRYALVLAIGLPTTVWQSLLLRSDPTWAAKAATPTPSPALSGYLLGYGLVLVLAVAGIVVARRGPRGQASELPLSASERGQRSLLRRGEARPTPSPKLGEGAGGRVLPGETDNKLTAAATKERIRLPLSASERGRAVCCAGGEARPTPSPKLGEGAGGGVLPGEAAVSPLWLLVLWLVVGGVLVYAPLAFQRKLAEGLHLPMCLLAAVALATWARRLSRSSFVLLALAAVVLTLPSNLYFVTDCLAHMRMNNRDLVGYLLPPAYLTGDELAGLRWLGQHTSERDVVMASSLMANYLPAAAPCRVVAGHWGETVDFSHAVGYVLQFYSPARPPEMRLGLLRYLGVDLVVYGPEERIFQRTLWGESSEVRDPAEDLPGLQAVFRQGKMTIYAVRSR